MLWHLRHFRLSQIVQTDTNIPVRNISLIIQKKLLDCRQWWIWADHFKDKQIQFKKDISRKKSFFSERKHSFGWLKRLPAQNREHKTTLTSPWPLTSSISVKVVYEIIYKLVFKVFIKHSVFYQTKCATEIVYLYMNTGISVLKTEWKNEWNISIGTLKTSFRQFKLIKNNFSFSLELVLGKTKIKHLAKYTGNGRL